MTREEKELLLKDLSARLPYKPVMMRRKDGDLADLVMIEMGYPIEVMYATERGRGSGYLEYRDDNYDGLLLNYLPCLRPMSSMTDGEKEVFKDFQGINIGNPVGLIDWLNEHYFDYRGLIEKGLALEAKEEMYKID